MRRRGKDWGKGEVIVPETECNDPMAVGGEKQSWFVRQKHPRLWEVRSRGRDKVCDLLRVWFSGNSKK